MKRLAGIFALATAAAPAFGDTIAEAVAKAVRALPEVRVAQANRRAIQQNVTQAQGLLFPSVDLNLGQGRETSNNPSTRPLGGDPTLRRREAEITLTQLVFDGGSATGQVRRFENRVEGATAQVAGAANTAGLRAGQAYVDVLRLRGMSTLASDNVKRHEETLAQVLLLSDSGRGRRSDSLQAEARLALAQTALSQLRSQLSQSEADYRHLVGIPPEEVIDPGQYSEKLPQTLEQALEQALASHPGIRAAEQDFRAAQEDRESARAKMISPRLTIEAGATKNNDLDGIRGLNGDSFVMFRLRTPLFRGGADEGRVRETEARVDEAMANVGKARNDVERDLRQAWGTLEEERVRLPQQSRYAATSGEVVEAYRAQFMIGQRSLLDVLNSENELYTAKSNLFATYHAVIVDELRVLAAMGRLLQLFSIELEVANPEPGEMSNR